MKIPIYGYYIVMKNCPICKSIAKPRFQDYISKDKKVVPDVATYICTNLDCAHTWLPIDEENRIDKALGVKKCGICKRRLNTRSPLSKDCGGDCLKCMAEAGDSDAIKEIKRINK